MNYEVLADRKKVGTADATLRLSGAGYTFREKLDAVRLIGGLGVDTVEFGEIGADKSAALLCRTAAGILGGKCAVAVTVTGAPGSAEAAWGAVSGAEHPRLTVALPVSTVGAEYMYHKKPDTMIELIRKTVAAAAALCPDVEFRAVDAMRSAPEVLEASVRAAVEAGAGTVSICDTAGEALPEEMAAACAALRAAVGPAVGLSVECSDRLGLASACAAAAVRAGADGVVCTVGHSEILKLENLAAAVAARGETLGVCLGVDTTSLSHTAERVCRLGAGKAAPSGAAAEPFDPDAAEGSLAADAEVGAVAAAASRLGYELSEDDKTKVHEAFRRLAAKSGKKTITARELDAIVASNAMQVPPTFRLVEYVINSGNVIASTAHVKLEKNGELLSGLCSGDGPIDAAFLAVEQSVGHHYELDDFQIRSVTEGREAMGEAIVRLRYDGKLYSGRGISTDIIGASIRAYINALNKITYEQVQ